MAHKIPVKYYYGGSVDSLQIHPSYPIMSGNSNTVINIFDKCLVSGFGSIVVNSISIDATGFSTVTYSNHGYNKTPIVLLISGSPNENLNGEWELTGFTSTTLTIDTRESGLTNVVISGTITIKIAPLGWEKVFDNVANSVAVYRSSDPLSRRHFLRLDDYDGISVPSRFSYLRGYENMSSSDDVGTYPYPLQSSFSRGLGIVRSLYSNPSIYFTSGDANISWTLVGTSKQFYFFSHYVNGGRKYSRMFIFFGDLNSYVPGDFGASALLGGTTFVNIYNPNFCCKFENYQGFYTSRNSSKLHSIINQRCKLWSAPSLNNIIGASTSNIYEPDLFSNRIILFRPILLSDEQYPNYIRGEMPGMTVPLNTLSLLPNQYSPNELITVKGERFMVMGFSDSHLSTTEGNFLLSIDKDWNNHILI